MLDVVTSSRMARGTRKRRRVWSSPVSQHLHVEIDTYTMMHVTRMLVDTSGITVSARSNNCYSKCHNKREYVCNTSYNHNILILSLKHLIKFLHNCCKVDT